MDLLVAGRSVAVWAFGRFACYFLGGGEGVKWLVCWPFVGFFWVFREECQGYPRV